MEKTILIDGTREARPVPHGCSICGSSEPHRSVFSREEGILVPESPRDQVPKKPVGPVPLDVLMSEIMERRRVLREWERQRYLLRKSTPLEQLRELNAIIRREKAFLRDLSLVAAQFELPLK